MKKASLFIAAILTAISFSQCSNKKETIVKTGLPGDNLDLYATLDLFKESESPEAFEKSLNDASRKINNLDLDENGKADYIRVIDQAEGANHTLVLRIDVNENESQDIAVIEIENNASQSAFIQLIGDEDLYGAAYIVEPKSEEDAAGFVMVTSAVAVNVWAWPCVTYIYSPEYIVWVSPWQYAVYPAWWEPWPVVSYESYYPMFTHHHIYYERAAGYRFVKVHEKYHYHIRHSSPFVYDKHHGPGSWKVKNKHGGKPGDPFRSAGNDKHKMKPAQKHSDQNKNSIARDKKPGNGSSPFEKTKAKNPKQNDGNYRPDGSGKKKQKPKGANQYTTTKKSPSSGNIRSSQHSSKKRR